jgi:hypothetical protein
MTMQDRTEPITPSAEPKPTRHRHRRTLPRSTWPEAVPRKPKPAPTVAVMRVENGYIVCENDRMLPSRICTDWPQVMQSIWQALHPGELFPPSPGLPSGLQSERTAATPPLTAPLLLARDLAAILRVEPRTIRLWTQKGMPAVPAGRKVRYRLEECETWLRDQKARTRAHASPARNGQDPTEPEPESTV